MLNNLEDNLVTPFEKRVITFVRQSVTALRNKGYNPDQCLKIITQGEPPVTFPVITWALAETMLFVEINRLYARNRSSDVINFIEATEIEDDVSSDDDIPF